MKKFITFMTILSFIAVAFYMSPLAKNSYSTVDNLTTLNFYEREDEFDFHNIKKLCSYEFCEYMMGETLEEGLDNFTKSYLKTISDEEVRSIIKVKGVKITKIIYKN